MENTTLSIENSDNEARLKQTLEKRKTLVSLIKEVIVLGDKK